MMALRPYFTMDRKSECSGLDRRLAPCPVRAPGNAPVHKRKKLPWNVLVFPGYVVPGRGVYSRIYFNQRGSQAINTKLQFEPRIFNRNPILQSKR